MRAVRRIALIALLVAGCGGGDGGAVGGDDGLKALEYFPPNSALVAVVSTDLESDQFENLDRLVRKQGDEPIESELREIAQDLDLSWEDDLKPLLGNELAGGIIGGTNLFSDDFEFVIAFHSADGDKLRELLDRDRRLEHSGEVSGARVYKVRGTAFGLALDDDVLVVTQDDDSLREALERADGDDHLVATFDGAHDDLPDDALFRLFADAEAAASTGDIEDLVKLRKVPWVAALETIGFGVSFNDEDVTVDFALNTDAEKIDENDLPLATGDEAPEILERDDQVTGGNRNQSLTTAFLFRTAEALWPDSKFVRDVHALERELGIDFEDEVLRQFNGPSASAVSVDGQTFAARSTVRDPARLKQLLPRLAPHLPRLVAGLEALQAEGQAILFLFAPDVLVLQTNKVEVARIDDDLWQVSGLTGEGPDRMVFGVLGDIFVVASAEELARQVAKEETVPVDGARGAGVLRVDLARAAQEARERFGFDEIEGVGELVAWLEASEERLRGQVRVELTD